MKFAAVAALLLLPPAAAEGSAAPERKRQKSRRAKSYKSGSSDSGDGGDGGGGGGNAMPWSPRPDPVVSGAPHEVHQYEMAKYFEEPEWECRFADIEGVVGCLACKNPRPTGGEGLVVAIKAMYKRDWLWGEGSPGGGSMSMSMSMSASMSMRRRLADATDTAKVEVQPNTGRRRAQADDACPFCPVGLEVPEDTDTSSVIPGTTCGMVLNFADGMLLSNQLCPSIIEAEEICCPTTGTGPLSSDDSPPPDDGTSSMSMSMSMSMNGVYYTLPPLREHCIWPGKGEFWSCFNSNLVIEPDTDWLGELKDKPIYKANGNECTDDELDVEGLCGCYPGKFVQYM